MSTLRSINPYSGEVNATFETLSDNQVNEKIEKAHTAFLDWKNTSFQERKELFYKLADIIEADLENYAKMQTLEMGMLIGPSIKGLQGTSKLIKWFADNAEKYIGEENWNLNGMQGKYMYDPLGVIF